MKLPFASQTTPGTATRKIFVLGDSRTGTLTLSNFFDTVGFRSIHYYEKEADQLPHTPENHEENFRRIQKFIAANTFVAFSDYPTRLYYADFAREYPDSFFILTTRRNIDIWKKSMFDFFSKFLIELDMDDQVNVHTQLNADIREFFAQHGDLSFIEICIDDGSEINTDLLKTFLDLETDHLLGWDNQTKSIRNEIVSGRYQLLSASNANLIENIERSRKGYKGLLSEYGWVYLINDSNYFLKYMFEGKRWNAGEIERAVNIVRERADYITRLGAKYLKFIIPEKPVIYPEFLPKAFHGMKQNLERPANQLSSSLPEIVTYLADYLVDAKSYGPLYFRGDTHINWLGAYLTYQFVINKIQPSIGAHFPSAIALGNLTPSLYGYDGDVFTQISPNDQARLNDQWLNVQFSGAFEYCIKYELPATSQRGHRVPPTGTLAGMHFSREITISEIDDPTLPTAVIFRDSTTDMVNDLIAEHFRRVVFIWHQGEVIKEVIEIEHPDVVLHFMAERFVSAYPKDMVALSNIAVV